MDIGAIRAKIELDTKNFNEGVERARSQTQKLGDQAKLTTTEFNRLALAFGAVTTALGALTGQAIKTAANFEASMSRVSAITGATTEQFEALEKQAMELGATTVFSASQAAEGMSFLAMAGFDTNEILAAMPGVLNLAAAGQMDLARASDIASNILTGFQLSAEESGRVVDVMAKAMTTANTNIEQLGYAMKYVAPVAASVGLSIEETAAAVGKLSDSGRNAA